MDPISFIRLPAPRVQVLADRRQAVPPAAADRSAVGTAGRGALGPLGLEKRKALKRKLRPRCFGSKGSKRADAVRKQVAASHVPWRGIGWSLGRHRKWALLARQWYGRKRAGSDLLALVQSGVFAGGRTKRPGSEA
jgi:hypothetical protein